MSLLHGPLGMTQESPKSSELRGTREFLGFVLGSESYALPLSNIREIMRAPQITTVPRGPKDVLGIVSVRGEVTTLVDLRRRLNMPETPMDERTRVLLVDHGAETLGLLVDRVLHVYRLLDEEVELAAVLGGESSNYIIGVGRPGGERSTRTSGERITGTDDILILLDPIALLKPYDGG